MLTRLWHASRACRPAKPAACQALSEGHCVQRPRQLCEGQSGRMSGAHSHWSFARARGLVAGVALENMAHSRRLRWGSLWKRQAGHLRTAARLCSRQRAAKPALAEGSVAGSWVSRYCCSRFCSWPGSVWVNRLQSSSKAACTVRGTVDQACLNELTNRGMHAACQSGARCSLHG